MKENSLEARVAHRCRCPAALQPGLPRAPSPGPPGAWGTAQLGSPSPGAPAHSAAPSPRPPGRVGAPIPRRSYLPEGRSPAALPGCPPLAGAEPGAAEGPGPGRAGGAAASSPPPLTQEQAPSPHAAPRGRPRHPRTIAALRPAGAGAGRTCGLQLRPPGHGRAGRGGEGWEAAPGRGGGVGPAPSPEGERGGSCRRQARRCRVSMLGRGPGVPVPLPPSRPAGPRCSLPRYCTDRDFPVEQRGVSLV